MAFTDALVRLVLCSGLLQCASGNIEGSVKPARPLVGASWAHIRNVKQSLSDVLDDALGHEHRKATDVHVDRLKETLRPIYVALPKNGHGLLGHTTVRYALHRHFVHKHGMYIKGFEPAGESWNSSSPADILEDRVPAYVQHQFEERLHDGFSLEELALFAATLEHFVHLEAVERLKGAYRLAGESHNRTVNFEQLTDLVDRFLFMQLVVGGDSETISRTVFDKQFSRAEDLFPEWADTQSFAREVLQSTLDTEEGGENGPHGGPYSFTTASHIVDTVGQRYGRFQDAACRALSKDLIAKEDKRSGRIKLSDFYQAGWQFKESADYLRSLGALDETGEVPRVIIANYVGSTTNCLASSSIFSVCCIDQCEELLGHLERRLLAPHAKPEQIVELVSALPSATTAAPRQLSDSLVRHLNDIAESNRGQVPLHGRLFAQWLHHAYPRECPFPAVSGTTKPMTADEWLKQTNSSVVVSNADMESIIAQAKDFEEHMQVKDLVDGDLEETLPWLADEELVFHHARASLAHELMVIARATACIGAVVGLAFGLSQRVMGARKVVQVRTTKV